MSRSKEVEIGGTVNEVFACDASTEDFKMVVEAITLGSKEGIKIKLDNPVSWDDDDKLAKEIRNSILGDDKWPDTMDPEWTGHRLVQDGKWHLEIAKFAVMNPYFTTKEVKEEMGIPEGNTSAVYQAERKGLIKSVEKDGQAHIRVPTHLAYKEVVNELDLETLRILLHNDLDHSKEHPEHENPQTLADFNL